MKALQIAGPLDQLTEVVVAGAYRAMARAAHPDAGGSAEQFTIVNNAKTALGHWLAGRAAAAAPDITAGLCERCGGTGWLRMRAGFSSGFRQQCPKCRGSGDANFDHDHTVN